MDDGQRPSSHHFKGRVIVVVVEIDVINNHLIVGRCWVEWRDGGRNRRWIKRRRIAAAHAADIVVVTQMTQQRIRRQIDQLAQRMDPDTHTDTPQKFGIK